MDDLVLVRTREPFSRLDGEIHSDGERQRAFPQPHSERFAGVIGHRDEELPVPLPDLVDRRDVGVVERARSLRLNFDSRTYGTATMCTAPPQAPQAPAPDECTA